MPAPPGNRRLRLALGYHVGQDDRDRLQQVYKRASARAQSGRPMSAEEIYIELSKVHKTSKATLPIFDDFIRDNQRLLDRCIIFVETKEYGEEVLKIVHRYRHGFHTYFAEVSNKRRPGTTWAVAPLADSRAQLFGVSSRASGCRQPQTIAETRVPTVRRPSPRRRVVQPGLSRRIGAGQTMGDAILSRDR